MSAGAGVPDAFVSTTATGVAFAAVSTAFDVPAAADVVSTAEVDVFASVIPSTLSTEVNETPMVFAICDAPCPCCFNAWICWLCVSRTVSVDLLATVEV
jgi:hypothetical protein